MKETDRGTTRGPAGEPLILEGAVCAGCGCLCDDVSIRFEGGRAAEVRSACSAGEAWIRSLPPLDPEASIDGKPAPLGRALDQAGNLLRAARAPAVIGLTGLSLEAIREAILLAERLPAPIIPHPATPSGLLRSGLHAPECTATLGEVRGTADLVIFWRADPERTHPRHLERYSLEPPLVHPPTTGRPRAVAVVDLLGPDESATAGRARDVFIFEDPGGDGVLRDLEIVRSLRLLLEKEEPPAADEPAGLIIEALARRLREARHAHFILGETAAGSPTLWNEIHLLAARGREKRRVTASALGRRGNARGALEALTWQTGRPGASVFWNGSRPRDLAGAVSAEDIIEAGAADLLLSTGFDPYLLHDAALSGYRRSRRIVLGGEIDEGAAVSIRAAGLDPRSRGTVVRSDGIHLTLRGRRTEAPGADDIADDIIARLLGALAKGVA